MMKKEEINISGISEDLSNSIIENSKDVNDKISKSILKGKRIAISVSENEDLNKLGFTIQHINDISIEIARYIIVNGGTALYGGDLRNGGFTEYFSELSHLYKITNEKSFRFINYFPFPNSKSIDQKAKADFKAKQIEPKILPIPSHLGKIDIYKEYKPFSILQDRYIYCECFKDMRKKMASDCDARILIGGKQKGYLGYIPGIIEEALLTFEANKPLYLIGGFGGATSSLIKLLKKQEPIELSNEFQYDDKFLKDFKNFVKDKNEYSDYDKLIKLLSNYSITSISATNGLSVEENEILFSSKNIHEILYLLIKGLRNI